MRRRAHFDDADDAGLVAVGVIEERAIADFHLVAHEVARLIVANAGPRRRLVLRHVVDAVGRRFGLDQPVAHGVPLWAAIALQPRRCSLRKSTESFSARSASGLL